MIYCIVMRYMETGGEHARELRLPGEKYIS
jgi:hypothetical protein